MSEAAWSETVWNVVLRLSLVSCPVRLVPAVAPIDREFETLLAGSGLVLDLTHFVRSDTVERARVATSYDLYPNGPVAAETLDALHQAMRRSARDAVAFVSHGEGERMLLIEPYGGGLRLSIMRRPLVAPGVYEEPAERQVPAELVEMAEAAIAKHLHDEDANALHERYENRLSALIARKTGQQTGGSASPDPEAAAAVFGAEAEAAGAPEAAPPEHEPEAAADIGLGAALDPATADKLPREIGAEILLRLVDFGDRSFDGPGWAGMPGSGRRIEAISIRPREELTQDTVEFRVFAAGDRATPWVGNGNYAGTSGRELALTGFAARPTPQIADRFDIVYEGWFADGGAVGPLRNGESCLSPVPDDPIEALRVSFIERRSEPAPSVPE